MQNRNPTLGQVIRRAVAVGAINLRVSMPGKIVDYNKDLGTATVTPMLPEIRHNDDDTYTTYKLPDLFMVPVQFYGDSDFAITVPVRKDSECLLVFCDRRIDKWLINGTSDDPESLRRHDISDAVAILGVRSGPNVFPDYSAGYMQMGEAGGPKISTRSSEIHIGHDSATDSPSPIPLGDKLVQDLQATLNSLNNFLTQVNAAASAGSPSEPAFTAFGKALQAAFAANMTTVSQNISNLSNDLSQIVKVS